jgi:acetoin utilization deacetylase AcuC-like enzyme
VIEQATGLFTHPDCVKHTMPGHPERPERLVSVMERLRQSGLLRSMKQHMAAIASDEDLSLVHPGSFIRHVADSSPANETIRLDPDTYMSPGSLTAARLAAGACLQATDAVASGALRRAFCAVRPPGHHAEIATAMGFCLFNNVALAAERALQSAHIDRVAILDFDVHHCNGTVDIFKDRPEVMVCSSFQDDFYPYRYLDYRNDHIITTPLAAGTIGRDFQRAIASSWFPAIETFRPDLFLISAGFDADEADPVGELRLGSYDFRWVTERISELANDHADGRIVSTLEGGYDLDALADGVEAHVESLMV